MTLGEAISFVHVDAIFTNITEIGILYFLVSVHKSICK